MLRPYYPAQGSPCSIVAPLVHPQAQSVDRLVQLFDSSRVSVSEHPRNPGDVMGHSSSMLSLRCSRPASEALSCATQASIFAWADVMTKYPINNSWRLGS